MTNTELINELADFKRHVQMRQTPIWRRASTSSRATCAT